MAANANSFGISIGLDLAICVIILLFFGYIRRTQWTEKFYESKRYVLYRVMVTERTEQAHIPC